MPDQTTKPKLVLVHGWGLNNAIWQPLIGQISENYDVLALNLSGYGDKTQLGSSNEIKALANELLSEVESPMHWCAWSLGGMAALQAAINQPEKFLSLSLLCTTPKFVQSDDWPVGVEMDTFQLFADQLKQDYETGIQQFLLLQAGAGAKARNLAKSAAKLLSNHPAPSSETLQSGLDILRDTDLREALQYFDPNIPCQVISGKRDRVIHPDSGKTLSAILPNTEFHLINSGHAPLLSNPEELIALLSAFISSAESTLKS